MKEKIKNFSFPFSKVILIFSTVLLFGSIFITPLLDKDFILHSPHTLKYSIFGITLITMLGFVYSILAFHFKTVRGDELKLRIHLESLNIAFTSSLVSLFVLIFILVNFWLVGLNYILIFITVVGIISYVLAVEFIKEKYE